MESLYKLVHDSHEELLKKVLRMALKREPTIEDAKRCTITYRNDPLEGYPFSMDGVTLGHVKF